MPRSTRRKTHRERGGAPRAPDRLNELAPPECAGPRCVLREVPADHWGHPFVLQKSSGTIRVVSLGSDGQLGTSDDLIVEVPCPLSTGGVTQETCRAEERHGDAP